MQIYYIDKQQVMKYIKRTIDQELIAWSQRKDRKPLLLRGARQVGKTSAVRHLGQSFKSYVEIDLNERRDLHSVFSPQNSPQQICNLLEVLLGVSIIAGDTLLVLDEIQACPEAINKLRYFYERYPQLHVVATGSLLEFALSELPSFGVGRVESMFMYPFSFSEFLCAIGNESLLEVIKSADITHPLLNLLHDRANALLKVFMSIGGMPEVVSAYVTSQNLRDCQRILDTLIVSYRADFKKYHKKLSPQLIDDAWISIAEQGSGKFVYSRVSRDLRSDVVKQAVQTLQMAGLVHTVVHTAANGLPLGAEVNRKYCRVMMMDTGIAQRLLNLNLLPFLSDSDTATINKGAIAEIYVAGELLKTLSPYSQHELYCWHREESSGNAELDFVVEKNGKIIPVEVKSGTKGAMQSMHYFMQLKGLDVGIRTSLENYGAVGNIEIVPLYAIAEWMKR